MYYKYRLSDNRILVAGPDPIISVRPEHAVVEIGDTTAYLDHTQVYRITDTLDGVEVDPTYVPPEFDLGTAELKALLKLIVDQFNILRLAAGMNEITYQQAKTVIKEELGL